MKTIRNFLVTIVLLSAIGGAHAAIVYSDYAPGARPDTSYFSLCDGYCFSGTGKATVGYAFQANSNYDITQIDILASVIPDYNNPQLTHSGAVTVSLWQTTPYNAPYTVEDKLPIPSVEIGSWSATAPTSSLGFTTLSGISGTSVVGGQTYLLMMTVANPNTYVGWFTPSTGKVAGSAYTCTTQPPGASQWAGCAPSIRPASAGMGAFDLIGTPSSVPLPAAVWLFGSGVLGLASLSRKRKAA